MIYYLVHISGDAENALDAIQLSELNFSISARTLRRNCQMFRIPDPLLWLYVFTICNLINTNCDCDLDFDLPKTVYLKSLLRLYQILYSFCLIVYIFTLDIHKLLKLFLFIDHPYTHIL